MLLGAEPMIIELIQGFRHTFRQLSRSRAFTITAILTLALGIGANVVVFSVLNAMVSNIAPIRRHKYVCRVHASVRKLG